MPTKINDLPIKQKGDRFELRNEIKNRQLLLAFSDLYTKMVNIYIPLKYLDEHIALIYKLAYKIDTYNKQYKIID